MVDNWKEFQKLKNKFEDETGGHSVWNAKFRNKHFQKMLLFPNIIELFINDFLYGGAAHWHYKLVELTGENPCDALHWGKMQEIRQDWLAWGYEKGIIKDEKKIRNMKSHEAIEIASLIFPFPDLIVSKMQFHFSGFDPNEMDDAREVVQILFKAQCAGKTEEVKIEINPSLDCTAQYMKEDFFNKDSPGYQKYYLWEDLPLRNQYYVQAKFIEWGYQPDEQKPKIFMY